MCGILARTEACNIQDVSYTIPITAEMHHFDHQY